MPARQVTVAVQAQHTCPAVRGTVVHHTGLGTVDGDTGPSIGRCSVGNGFKVIAVGHSIVVLVGCSLHLRWTAHFLAAVTVDGKLVCRRQVQSRHHVAHPPFAPRRLRAGNHRPLATGNPPFHRHLFAAPFAVPLQRDTVVGPSRYREAGQ